MIHSKRNARAMIAFVLFLFVNTAFADNVSPECKELFKQNDPRPCCLLPEALSPKENEEKCKQTCKDQVDDKCCAYDCENELDGLFVDGVIHKDKILKSFEIYFTETKTEGYEDWKATIEASFATCDALFTKYESEPTCKTPPYVLVTLMCINQQNFLNCPATFYNTTANCDTVKNFVRSQDTCGKKIDETFLIDDTFWDGGEVHESVGPTPASTGADSQSNFTLSE